MIEIDNKIVSRDLFSEEFVCNLNACKGECCISGDAGAPVEENEIGELNENLELILPFLSEEGKKTIENLGVSVEDEIDSESVTPLIEGKACAYAIFEKNGTASCGIERSFLAGKSKFRKPISCHLYPVRVKKYSKFTALNYHRWEICSDACILGKSLGIKVYRFLKEPLIRAFGDVFYNELEMVDAELNKKEDLGAK